MVIESAKRVLEIESKAVASLMDRVDERFAEVLEILFNCRGRIVLTGMGKSGIIGKKIASTLSSTGSPAIYLHPAEGIHGDLGMLTREDVVVAVSNSGETEEIINLLPTIKRFDIRLVGLLGNMRSTLASTCDVALDVSVAEEACSLGLVPTASTTAAMAMGDALAMALLERKGFTRDDFALLHPGGVIGKRHLLKVEDLMRTGAEMPVVKEDSCLKDVIYEISSKTLGMTCVVDEAGALKGVITDGDLRRLMEKTENPFRTRASDFMTLNPKIIGGKELAMKALSMMEHHSITSLIILDDDSAPRGVIHIHDTLKAGIA